MGYLGANGVQMSRRAQCCEMDSEQLNYSGVFPVIAKFPIMYTYRLRAWQRMQTIRKLLYFTYNVYKMYQTFVLIFGCHMAWETGMTFGQASNGK